ncbi:aminotransferase class I/II-fold pyridoxal phosphate-dependent enzyme [Candidatus Curtissbacteria bacterium]|nr:aminotransferase class I/II-fold pyridoxal phosphate-dependent enzyme [Candidatus Curtissbacteria bacterium]
MIAIDASPNTRGEDVILAYKLLLTPQSWYRREGIKKLEQYFLNRYKARITQATVSGRSALQFLLEAAIDVDDEVITQAFTCLAVPNAITWAGGKVVFADISEDTYNLDPRDVSKKITGKTKAVIVQHTFGIPASLHEIKRICEEHKLILIEDCAHSLGAKYDNQLVGTFGDGAIFSFSQDKVVSGVGGGLLLIRNKRIAKLFRGMSHKFVIPTKKEIARALFHPIFWSFALPTYDLLLGKGLIFVLWKLGFLKGAVSEQEQVGLKSLEGSDGLSGPQAQLVLQALGRLDQDNKRRIEIAQRYREELGSIPVGYPQPSFASQAIYLRYPIRVENPKKLRSFARRQNIILGNWYQTPIAPMSSAAKLYYTQDSCPVAEEVGRSVVNLPTYPRLSNKQVERVIKTLKMFYGRC